MNDGPPLCHSDFDTSCWNYREYQRKAETRRKTEQLGSCKQSPMRENREWYLSADLVWQASKSRQVFFFERLHAEKTDSRRRDTTLGVFITKPIYRKVETGLAFSHDDHD